MYVRLISKFMGDLYQSSGTTHSYCKVFNCTYDVIRHGLCIRHITFHSSLHTNRIDNKGNIDKIDNIDNINSIRCHLCQGQLRGTNRIIQICSKHRFSTAQDRPYCVATGCTRYPKRRTNLYCFRHDKRKQQERNLPQFLRDIDDIFDQQCDM